MNGNNWEKTISLKKNDSDHPKAPEFKGSLTLDGKQYNVALWPAKSGNGWFGKIEDRQTRDAVAQNVETAVDELEDSELPF